MDPSRSPIENKPHLWRELQAELLGFEQQVTGGKGFDTDQIETTLETSFPTKAPPTSKAASVVESLFGKPSRETVALLSALNPEHAHSLALAELASLIQGQDFEVDIEGLQASLDEGTRNAFEEWFKTRWRREFAGYVELAYIKRLADAPNLNWNLVQIAAETCLAGERVAAFDLLSPDWIRADVERADQYRFFAEQAVFDQVGLQWQQQCQELFEESGEIYAADELEFVGDSQVGKIARSFVG